VDREFTGEELHRLVLDIEAAIGRNRAGMTPLGQAVTDLAELTLSRDRAQKKAD
jgi:hypothetical protein